jgi:hypothetical protein
VLTPKPGGTEGYIAGCRSDRSILLVKVTTGDGSAQLIVRTLTQAELIKLENNPNLVRDPINTLAALAEKASYSQKKGQLNADR